MDSLIAAARACARRRRPTRRPKHVVCVMTPPALAPPRHCNGQLGEHPRARELLRRAARGFGSARGTGARQLWVAEAEVALAMRDLSGSRAPAGAAVAMLEARADRANALQHV